MKEARSARLWLLLILLVACGVRIWGCFGQGYPHSFYDDEKANVQRALNFGARKSLDPGWFNKPALGYYALFGQYGLYYMVAGYESPDEFALAYLADKGPFYLIGRFGTTIFGLLTVLLVYRLGRDLVDRRTGLLTALLLTLTLGHVASCQEVKMDVPAAFFTVWAAIFMVRMQRRGAWKDYLLAGLVTGLGVATKYIPAIMIVPLCHAHLFRSPGARDQAPRVFSSPRLAGGLLFVLVGFFAGSPYNFLNPAAHEWLLGHIGFAGQHFGFGCMTESAVIGPRGPVVNGTLGSALAAIFATLASPEGMGLPICVLGGLGFLAALFSRQRGMGLMIVTVISMPVLIAVFNRLYSQPRHLNVLYPFAAFFAARGFLVVWDVLARTRKTAASMPLAGLLILMSLPLPAWPVRAIIEHDRQNAAEDPRLAFMRWFEEHVPAGATVINDFGRLPIVASSERCTWMLKRIDFLEAIELLSADRAETYRRFWQMQGQASKRHPGPTYDVIELAHPWQVERLPERLAAGGTYNPLWPDSPWGWLMLNVLHEAAKRGELEEMDASRAQEDLNDRLRPEERKLAPVERWTRPTLATALFFLEGAPGARWFVTTKLTCENYKSAHKRENFPDFAEFYDDLSRHHDGLEFNSDDADPSRVVRLYDLSKRVDMGRLQRVP